MQIEITYINKDFSINDLNNDAWKKACRILIENYWSGEKAEIGRHAQVRLLWSETSFYVRFEANQSEPLTISATPILETKTIGLWERDVCEIFVAPNCEEPNRYFEFEIAPTGEWLDLEIRRLLDKRETDFNYNSGMQSASLIGEDSVTSAIRIEWKAFGKTPRADEIWRGNLFRCVGSGDKRGYLAWSPTHTEQPNFHVPEAFGDFWFSK